MGSRVKDVKAKICPIPGSAPDVYSVIWDVTLTDGQVYHLACDVLRVPVGTSAKGAVDTAWQRDKVLIANYIAIQNPCRDFAGELNDYLDHRDAIDRRL